MLQVSGFKFKISYYPELNFELETWNFELETCLTVRNQLPPVFRR
jgi:hypothetical protein